MAGADARDANVTVPLPHKSETNINPAMILFCIRYGSCELSVTRSADWICDFDHVLV